MYGNIHYGELLYSQEQPENEEIEMFIPNLMEYLPPYYGNSKVMKNIQSVIAKEVGTQKYASGDVLKQFFVDTATWGLDLWEEELGLEVDKSKTNEVRREVLKAKLRGTGTVTKEMLKNTCLAYTNAEVAITEDYANYQFIIKFVGVKGIPPNMEGLIQTIDEIKPAHLGYEFQYTYTVWQMLTDKGLTWQQAQTKTWDELRVFE